jgi:hypothetical protein
MSVGETSALTAPSPAVAMRQLTLGVLVSQALSVIARLGVADKPAAGGPHAARPGRAPDDSDRAQCWHGQSDGGGGRRAKLIR